MKKAIGSLILLITTFALSSIAWAVTVSSGGDDIQKLKIQEAYGKIPLHFIKNNGQIDKDVL